MTLANKAIISLDGRQPLKKNDNFLKEQAQKSN